MQAVLNKRQDADYGTGKPAGGIESEIGFAARVQHH